MADKQHFLEYLGEVRAREESSNILKANPLPTATMQPLYAHGSRRAQALQAVEEGAQEDDGGIGDAREGKQRTRRKQGLPVSDTNSDSDDSDANGTASGTDDGQRKSKKKKKHHSALSDDGSAASSSNCFARSCTRCCLFALHNGVQQSGWSRGAWSP